MKKLKIQILFFIIVCLTVKLKGQKISVLIFSDTIQNTLYSKINQKEDSQKMYFACISFLDSNKIKINLSRYDSLNTNFTKTKLINSSNCRIQINTLQIPVLYELDFLYSNLVKRTNDEGFIIEENYPITGFYVLFNKYNDNVIIETGINRY